MAPPVRFTHDRAALHRPESGAAILREHRELHVASYLPDAAAVAELIARSDQASWQLQRLQIGRCLDR